MPIRESIKRLTPYKPPLEGREGSDYLLLDFNERTTPPSPAVEAALLSYIKCGGLQRYPEYGDVLTPLAQYTGVRTSELMITNGSDQAIDLIYRLVAEPGLEAIVPAPTFPMLDHSAEVSGMTVIRPVYTKDFSYPVDDVLKQISKKTRIIVVCSPNNPTGTLVPKDQILTIAKEAPHAALLVDECYFEYSQSTVADSINNFSNLFITRTFSKTWGIPSLRFGYIITNSHNIEQLSKIRGPYDVNRLAVVAAQAALTDLEHVRDYVQEVIQISRPKLEAYLDSKQIAYWPSAANFLLCHFPDAKNVLEQLRLDGILVRPRSGPGIEGTLRITVGTAKQTQRLINSLDKLL
jgi:histidinol-phosphate aminotransferase